MGSQCYLRFNQNKRKCLAFFDGLHSSVSGLHPLICESIFPQILSLIPNWLHPIMVCCLMVCCLWFQIGSILSWFVVSDSKLAPSYHGHLWFVGWWISEWVSKQWLSTFQTELVGWQVHLDLKFMLFNFKIWCLPYLLGWNGSRTLNPSLKWMSFLTIFCSSTSGFVMELNCSTYK